MIDVFSLSMRCLNLLCESSVKSLAPGTAGDPVSRGRPESGIRPSATPFGRPCCAAC